MISAPPFPVIGISGASADSASVRTAMTQIRDTGAIPIFLSNHSNRNASADIEKLDGLLVLGNNADIDPERYGETTGAHTKPESATPEGKARAEYEYEIMRLALEKKLPVMAYCGGMQRLDVMLGGSLHQHVPDLTGNDDHAQQDLNIAPFIPVQAVVIQKGSTLSSIAGNIPSVYTPAHGAGSLSIVMENSMHHQAVNAIGQGLRSSAISTDGIIEAVEADPNGPFKDQFVLGVQWHPEFGASALGSRLAQHFVSEAQRYAMRSPHEHPTISAIIEENKLSSLPVMKMPARNEKISFTSNVR